MKINNIFHLLFEARIPTIATKQKAAIEIAYNNDHSNPKPHLTDSNAIASYISDNISHRLYGNNAKEFPQIQQVINWYVKGDFVLDDINDVANTLHTHLNHDHVLGNLSDFKDLESLHQKALPLNAITYEFNGTNFKVMIPHSAEAAQSFHKFGSWCTSWEGDRCRFDGYKYPLYYIKAGKSWFLFCFGTGEINNSINQPANPEQLRQLETIPNYKKFLLRHMKEINSNAKVYSSLSTNSILDIWPINDNVAIVAIIKAFADTIDDGYLDVMCGENVVQIALANYCKSNNITNKESIVAFAKMFEVVCSFAEAVDYASETYFNPADEEGAEYPLDFNFTAGHTVVGHIDDIKNGVTFKCNGYPAGKITFNNSGDIIVTANNVNSDHIASLNQNRLANIASSGDVHDAANNLLKNIEHHFDPHMYG
jgi:hypothetical protein